MMRRTILPWLYIAGYFGLTTGCIERELPIPERTPGDAVVRAVEMGSDYGVQLHVNLSSGDIVASHPKSAWCIRMAFNNDTVWMDLNSSRFMKFSMLESNLDPVVDADLLAWDVFDPSGRDSRNVVATGQTWAIDLGRNPLDLLESLGTLRVEILNVASNTVTIRIANLMTEDTATLPWDTLVVEKTPFVSNTHVSLLAKEQVNIEPEKGSWDLYFTQYTALLEGETGSTTPPTPYLVTGVLSHAEGVEVMQPQEGDWDDWIEWTWPEEELSSDWDVVGFDWKFYSIGEDSYTINPNNIYCIRNEEGREFLLRFLDFYDDQGNTGLFTYEILER